MYYVLFWMVVLTFQLNFNKKSKMLIKQQIIVPKCLFSNGFFKNYILLFEIRYTLWGVRTNLNVHRRPIANSFNISWSDQQDLERTLPIRSYLCAQVPPPTARWKYHGPVSGTDTTILATILLRMFLVKIMATFSKTFSMSRMSGNPSTGYFSIII